MKLAQGVYQRVALLMVWTMLFSLAAPIGGIQAVKASAAAPYFTMDFTNYAGSSSTITAPPGMGIANFTAEQDYIVGVEDTAKIVSNSGKYVHLYKSFSSPIKGKVSLEARVKFGDTEHERRFFNVNASNESGSYKATATLITFGTDGSIKLLDNVLSESYEKDIWYEIKLILDQAETKKVELYLNGDLKTHSVKLNDNWEQFNYFRIGQVGNSSPNGIMELDDIAVYEPEPSTPTNPPAPDPEPSVDYVEHANSKFDNYVGPTVSSGGSVKLDDWKVYNVVNGVNYITDTVAQNKEGKSLKFITSSSESKIMNLTKENFGDLLTGMIVMEANVRFEDMNVQRDLFALRNIGNVPGVSPKYLTLFSFMPDGTIRLCGKTAGAVYTTDEWYKVGVIIDQAKGNVSYYLNEAPLHAAGADLLPTGWESIFSVKFSQSGVNEKTSSMLLDDIRIYSGSGFLEEIDPNDIPPAKIIDGWEVRYVSGNPSSDKDEEAHLVPGNYIRANMAKGQDKTSLTKLFPVTGGKTYVVDAWTYVDTPTSTSVQSIVTPLAGSEPVRKNGKNITFYSQNNTRGEKLGTGWVRVRTYFEAPEEADFIRVQHMLAGPSIIHISTSLNERQEWQDVIGSYKSADIVHPIEGDITQMFVAWQWKPIAEETAEQTRQLTAPLMAMSDEELLAAASANARTRQYLDMHPEYEQMMRRLAILYHETGDEEYARKAILIMQKFASTYNDVPKIIIDNDLFHAHGKYIPMDALYGYDLIYNSEQWELLESKLGIPFREEIEGWFRASFMNLYNLHNDVYYSNITPYGIRNAMGLAVVLNDPDIIRLMLPWIDTMFSGKQFHADGMWEEGTVSYGSQVVNNVINALSLLESSYRDPDDYVDTKYGLKLNYTDLSSRWPLIEKSSKLYEQMKFPNGSTIGIHDTWTKGQKGEEPNKVTDPIYEKYLKNLELYHFGHYSLSSGDTSDATQVHLTFPPLAEGLPYSAGHYHGNHLGITLWGAGMEVLPDSGYPKGANRYFNMSAKTHNTAWVWNKDAVKYTDSVSLFTNPSLLAYDPGTRSNKTVQLVEASSPGPAGDLTEMKRRMLMMVQTEGNRSYVLDLQRLKGGQAHELFLHAVEEEDTDLSTTLELTEYPGYTVEQYMKEAQREEGMPEYRNMFKDPRVGAGENDFSFVWKGQESGSSVQTFMNGMNGSEDIFSRMPMNRLTQNDNAHMDDYPGWHFYRRHLVEPNEITRFGAVYETFRESQQPIVKSVEWKEPNEPDPMSMIAVVDMGEIQDIVYISDDTTKRSYDGITFAGKSAVIRQDKQTGRYIWGYVYGEGSIHAENFTVQGKPDLMFNAVEATGSLDGSIANSLKVDRVIPSGASLNGVWLRTEFGNHAGYGLRIEDVEGDTIQVHGTPGFEVTGGGARMLYFPGNEQPETGFLKLHAGDQQYYIPREVAGGVKVEIRQPVFVRSNPEQEEPGTTTPEPETSPEPNPSATEEGGAENSGSEGSIGKPVIFQDVANTHWAAPYIDQLSARKIIQGYPDGSFRPDGKITRGEVAAMLAKLLNLSTPAGASVAYVDVKAGDWYDEAIAAITDAGIVKGYNNGEFRPNRSITRQEAAVILFNVLNYIQSSKNTAAKSNASANETSVNVSSNTASKPFKDDDNISEWARAAIYHLLDTGIISGKPGNQFDPKASLSRAEAAKLIYSIWSSLQDLQRD